MEPMSIIYKDPCELPMRDLVESLSGKVVEQEINYYYIRML